MYVYISVCLSVFKYVFHYLILSVEACMEIVKDQGEHATAGWTGFQNKPTSKETAQRAVDLLGFDLTPPIDPLNHLSTHLWVGVSPQIINL